MNETSTNSEFGLLLADLWADMQEPDVLWQVGVLAVCLGLAWLVEKLVRQHGPQLSPADTRARQLGQRGFKRVVFPLSATLLVLAARPLLAHWHHVNLLSVAVPLLLSMAVIRSVFFVLRLSFSGAWLATFERSFAAIAWLVVALHITGLLPGVIQLLEEVGFTIGNQELNLWMIFQATATVLVAMLVALWAGGLIEARLMAASGLDHNLRIVFSRLAKAVLLLVMVMVALPTVGIDLTTLSVFGGALGVGLGLGLQKIAASYVSGFIILLDRSVRIGDLVAVGDSRGQISRITTRYTVLKGMSGVEAIVPNELMVASVVQNQSFSDTEVRVGLPIQVAYGTDLARAMAIMVEATAGQPRVLRQPPPKAFVVEFADSGINLEVGFWVADPHEGTLGLRSDINLNIWRAFQAEGIEIPFPQREVRLLNK